MKAWQQLLLLPTASIREAIHRIDSGNAQIALVVDGNGVLAGTVTDGDVRRGLLRGLSLEDPVSSIMNQSPTTGSRSEDRIALLGLMKRRFLHQIPLVDENGRVLGLETLDDLLRPARRENPVVLMAGGMGTRLRPLTEKIPKPMLRIGDKPILESILESFTEHGFWKFYFAVNYKAEIIERHFGDGRKWDAQIEYIREEKKLGTAGPLSLLPVIPKVPILVMNADILTRVNFSNLLGFHEQSRAAATICIREYSHTVPYGVVQMNENELIGIEEKPVQRSMVSAGIYVLEPQTLVRLQQGRYYEMPALLQDLASDGKKVIGFPVHEYWLDIGRLEDLERAHEFFSDQTSE
jgi:dTDP-glucose pyrophosphorylase